MRGVVEGRQGLAERLRFGHARSDELRVMLRHVLCQLVHDVCFARGIDGQRREPRANQRLPVLHGTSYSPRITVSGSTDDARRAGTYAAAALAASTTTDAVAMVLASNGRTSKSKLESSRLVTSDRPMPMTTPAAVRVLARATTIARMPRPVAPSAMRTPISRDRSATQ